MTYIGTKGQEIVVGGFYREWAREGLKSKEEQAERVNVFTNKVESATNQSKRMIILGDANLCSKKWIDPDYKHRKVTEIIKKKSLEHCGIKGRYIDGFRAVCRISLSFGGPK